MTFENSEPGRGCQALQGFAIDGREVDALNLSVQVRGDDIQQGQTPNQWPAIVITFYDERRAAVGEGSVGPFTGTFDWREESDTVRVPLRPRGGFADRIARRHRPAIDRQSHASSVTVSTAACPLPVMPGVALRALFGAQRAVVLQPRVAKNLPTWSVINLTTCEIVRFRPGSLNCDGMLVCLSKARRGGRPSGGLF